VEAPIVASPVISQAHLDGWFALVFAHAALTARVDAELMGRHHITFSAFEIFCRLLVTEPQPVRALGSKLISVSPTRASRIIQDHIDAGHLRRDADQGDGRISLVGFTDSGRRYAAAVNKTFEEAVKHNFVDLLDDADIAALKRIWQKIQNASQ
jgi:DNA-binding MarR family transcriptional regulator